MAFRQIRAFVVSALLLFSLPLGALAQGPKPRLATALDASRRVVLPGTRPAFAAHGTDLGALPEATPVPGITLVFNRSAAQQVDLEALLAAQQDTASPLYHQWLSPDQFAQRFGVADADMSRVETWLSGQGFRIDSVARSHDRLVFDGTAGQVAAAFGTQLHRYQLGSRVHFAPDSNLSVPAALAPMVTDVLRLSDFHLKRRTQFSTAPKPGYTSSVSPGNHFLTPSDLATMYDVSSTYKAGYNGAGQSIAIVGQSYFSTQPITAFQNGAGLPVNTPTLVLVPDTGVNAIDALNDGDEGETQLDVEYASGMAPGAKIYVVYTGDNSNAGVFESLTYAINHRIASVISGSYGVCETALNSSTGGQQEVSAINQLVQQANVQGQTIVFSSGDTGSTDCYHDTYLTATQQASLSVDFPASVPGITAVGGTQMAAGTYTAGTSQYWQTATGSDVISSLLSYVPEVVWNETSASGVFAGGGGSSLFFARPTWQTGVPGIPAGAQRLTPDISLQASTGSPGYIYCTGDAADLASQNTTATCTNGLRNPGGVFQVAGGTSFASPSFAGMLAVLNQVKHSTGQGNINPILYGLAGAPATYGSAFHDVTAGDNGCATATCPFAGPASYSATVGYDQATGLGTVDFAKLVAAWPSAAATALAASTTTVQVATATPAAGATDQTTVTVTPQIAGGATPTGTVQISVDGANVGTAVALVNGTASYTYTAPATGVGSHVISAAYSGDASYAPSTGSAVVTVGTTNASGNFTLAAAALTVPYNGVQSTALVLTPGAGYTGTVVLSLAYPTSSPTLCYAVSNPNTSGTNIPLTTGAAVTATLTIFEGTACGTTATGKVVLSGTQNTASVHRPTPAAPARRWPQGVALAGLFCVGLAFRRSRRLPALLGLLLIAGAGVSLSGCSSGAGNTTIPVPKPNTPQTLTVTVTGADSVNTGITNTTNLTLTLQ